jgi:hypothetical protein
MQTAQLTENLPLYSNNSLISLSIDTAKSPLLNQEKTYLVYLYTQDAFSNGTWLKNSDEENTDCMKREREREREREMCKVHSFKTTFGLLHTNPGTNPPASL